LVEVLQAARLQLIKNAWAIATVSM